MMGRIAIVLGLCAGLAGCSETETGADGEDSCGAAPYQTRIGQSVEELGLTPGEKLRILSPGQPMTMDFRPDRLNIETDSTGQILRAFCG
ncbi:I78 family peptidase inhibitor [Alloyangia pacifica]|uniref:I78 family peptidase inhibitor n=1 Tax=Alloyangia pacifica TaxID=311180 RepID=UPI001CFDBEDD|nr:I78 family peptidase inhibitor [Alloyangia pacifica]